MPMLSRLYVYAASILTPLALVAGCSGGEESGNAGPTYHVDAKPIFEAKCVGCHVAGGIAPFALTNYAEASKQAKAIAASVTAGTMPPWPASSDCNTYQGDRSLSADQIATLNAWVDGGALEGDPAAKPAPVEGSSVDLSRVDRTLAMPVAYTPTQQPDDYRCFIVDWPDTETTYITGFGVEPGTPAIVHHVIAYLAPPSKVASYQALDDAEDGPGYTCFGGPGDGRAAWIGGWAPGALGSDLPAGTGIEIAPGSKVVLQVHYNTSTAKPAPDQTKVLVSTATSVEKKATVLPWTNPSWLAKGMVIPAHSADTVHQWQADPTVLGGLFTGGAIVAAKPITIHSAGLHMHTRGTQARTEIRRGDGTTSCLLDIPSWNFHWQGSYMMTKPATLAPGDLLSLECHWDNSGSSDLNWGEGTNDEMCLGTYYLTQ